MKARPILFSGPMVRAILEGRKTQTRRIITTENIRFWSGGLDFAGRHVKPDSELLEHMLCDARDFRCADGMWMWSGKAFDYQAPATRTEWTGRCQYGKPGDVLWCREAWCPYTWHGPIRRGYKVSPHSANILFRANMKDDFNAPWRPSIHMPRWASRITLEIESIRVERLQDISEEDAIAEGCDNSTTEAARVIGWHEKPRRAFRRVWEQINGDESWTANPWVWVVEFKPHLMNVDEYLKQREAA